MSEFIPPYPKRHAQSLNPIEFLYHARKDLLSIWSEDYFKVQFRAAKILNRPMYIVNCPALVRYVFETRYAAYQQKSVFLQKALQLLLGDGLFISDGATWQTRRPILESLFTGQRMGRYAEIMIAAIDEMRMRWAVMPQGAEVQVLPEMAQLAMEINCRCLFGDLLDEQQKTAILDTFGDYQTALEQMDISSFLGLSNWLPNSQAGQTKRSAARLRDLFSGIISKGVRQPSQNSMLGLLLEANNSAQSLTLEQLLNEAMVLFMSGYAAIAYALTWTWYLISQRPDVEMLLQQELDQVLDGRVPTYKEISKLDYTRAIVSESMRLYPPMPLLARQSNADDVIRKHCIPIGATMLIVPWLLHRHALYWDKPDHFMPERFLPDAEPKIDPYAFIPFGVGPRSCLGQTFAMTEMVLSVAMLAQRFRLCLPPGGEVTHECRLFLRPKGNVPMRLEQRLLEN